VNVTARLRSGAFHPNHISGSSAEEDFRHLGPAGVPGAENQDEGLGIGFAHVGVMKKGAPNFVNSWFVTRASQRCPILPQLPTE
jgi:hypothetical protein